MERVGSEEKLVQKGVWECGCRSEVEKIDLKPNEVLAECEPQSEARRLGGLACFTLKQLCEKLTEIANITKNIVWLFNFVSSSKLYNFSVT